jgi:hypothetical protein
MTGRRRDRFGVAAKEFAVWLEQAGQEGAPRADPGEARLLLDLMRDYLGLADPGELTPGDLHHLLLEVYPRKVTVLDAQDTADTVPTIRALVSFLAETGRLKSPAALRDELDQLEPMFGDAVMDPARWGMARAFTQAMAADGVDFGDEAAVADWIAGHNAGHRPGLPGDGEPADGYLDDDDDHLDFDGDDGLDFRKTFGLPDRLPPLRLPGQAELARAARGSAPLAAAWKLAAWAGDGHKALTDDGELAPAEVPEAARLLSIDTPPGVAGAEAVPQLRQAWHLARCLWFVDEDNGHAVRPDDGTTWPDDDDDEALDIWSQALGHLVAHSLEVDDHGGLFGDLLTGAAGGGLIMALFLAREEGLPRSECSDLARETAVSGLNGAAARTRWAAWQRAHGDIADVLLERLSAHGAVEIGDAVARLTPLGLWQMREELTGEVDIPLLPAPAEMTAKDLVEFCAEASEAEMDRERDAWLATRPAEQAVRELLHVAECGCGERMIGASLATTIGAAGEPAWREALGHPELRPYAKLALNQIAGRDPASDPLPGMEVGPDDAVAMLGDVVAATAGQLTGAELSATLRQAVPAGQEERVIERMWRSDHPAAVPVLTALGRHHPDKKIAKAARKAAFKARSRS